MNDNFLCDYAATHHFSAGEPRGFAVAGERIFFLRSRSGTAPEQCLFMVVLTEQGIDEKLIIDPVSIEPGDALTDEERRRRERMREAGGGITSFSVDADGEAITVIMNNQIFVATRGQDFEPQPLPGTKGAFDPRVSPDGKWVAFVREGDVFVASTDGSGEPKQLTRHSNPDESWGIAEFIAAEEMDRQRGFWWSPDSQSLLITKVDNHAVNTWHIADPAQPEAEDTVIRYPQAGTANARVSLWHFSIADAPPVEIIWDQAAFEYLTAVQWLQNNALVVVQSRDQRRVQTLIVDATTGRTTVAHTMKDSHWVELIVGLPAQLADGRIAAVIDEKTRGLVIDGERVTPSNLELRAYYGQLNDGALIFSAHSGDSKQWQVYALNTVGRIDPITPPGVHSIAASGDVVIVRSLAAETTQTQTVVWRRKDGEFISVGQITSMAQSPTLAPRPRFLALGQRKLQTALLLPADYQNDHPLPVIMRPYAGPHAQQVIAAGRAYLLDQWYANQGFAVVIVDGRGTPGRGPEWEKAVAGDLLGPVLEDQANALQALAAQDERIDITRVGIMGWSFGGYLAAAAVLRHPELFKAGIAGAPVTDWRLYDTHYTERYLGDPAAQPEVYARNSLIEQAKNLTRPLLIIHGLADDNVVVAHSLRFSEALLVAGKPHQFLPLGGVTHMPKHPAVAENLERLQLEFLIDHLRKTPEPLADKG